LKLKRGKGSGDFSSGIKDIKSSVEKGRETLKGKKTVPLFFSELTKRSKNSVLAGEESRRGGGAVRTAGRRGSSLSASRVDPSL